MTVAGFGRWTVHASLAAALCVSLGACGGGSSATPLPSIHFKFDYLWKDCGAAGSRESFGIEHLLSDGTAVFLGPDGLPYLTDTQHHRTQLPRDRSIVPGLKKLTFWQDDRNYGGILSNTQSVVVIDGKASMCSAPCTPYGIYPAGGYYPAGNVFVVREALYGLSAVAWVPGSDITKSPVIVGFDYAEGQSAYFARFATNGAALFAPDTTATASGASYNKWTYLFDAAGPMPTGNFGLTRGGSTMNASTTDPPQLIGSPNVPLDVVPADIIVANSGSDALTHPIGGQLAQASNYHVRWKGTQYAYDAHEWEAWLGAAYQPQNGLPESGRDINDAGQILLCSLHHRAILLTPSTTPVSSTLGNLTFTASIGTAPATFVVEGPETITGVHLSGGALMFSLTTGAGMTSGTRFLNASLSSPSGTIGVGTVLAAATSVGPNGVTSIATVSYSDATSRAANANGGSFRVLAADDLTMSLHADHVTFVEPSGAAYEMNGDVTLVF